MEPGVDWSGGIKFQVAHFGINRGVDKEDVEDHRDKDKDCKYFCSSERLLSKNILNEPHGKV